MVTLCALCVPTGHPRATREGKRLKMSAVEALLRQRNPRFLDGVDAADVKTILGAGTLQRFSGRSVMISQGYPAGHLFLLLTGRARRFFLTHDGQKIVLLRVLSGDVFGEMAILDRPANYLVSTEAITNSSALVWNRSTIRSLCERYPRLVHNSFSISVDYLTYYRAAHVSLICNSAPQRLARILANLAEGIGHKVPGGGVELDIRNEELANEANVSVFTASRLLSAWQREGILMKRRGKVLLRFPNRLWQNISTSA
jgi:CRP/FNR family transcriptional regulator, nitrogen oxide reductase regulator